MSTPLEAAQQAVERAAREAIALESRACDARLNAASRVEARRLLALHSDDHYASIAAAYIALTAEHEAAKRALQRLSKAARAVSARLPDYIGCADDGVELDEALDAADASLGTEKAK